jgi:exodeoxyribonuclease-3
MRVMTYNILEGGKGRLDKIASVVRDQDPDILAVQEANGFDNVGNRRIQIFSDMIGMEYFSLATGNHNSRRNGRYHVATFSKHPLQPVPIEGSFHHAALHTRVLFAGSDVDVINAHLDPHFNESRVREMNRMLRSLEGCDPAMITGDLNSLSSHDDYSREVSRFTEYLKKNFVSKGKVQTGILRRAYDAGFVDAAVALDAQERTMPTPLSKYQDGLSFRVDYVLVSSGLSDKLARASVVSGEEADTASDHYPLVVDFS